MSNELNSMMFQNATPAPAPTAPVPAAPATTASTTTASTQVPSPVQPDNQASPNWFFPILLIAGMFAFLYFFTIRPQKKEADRRKSMMDALKVGDKILTIGGIYGHVSKISEEKYEIETAPGQRIEIAKFAIAEVVNAQPEEQKK